MENTPGEPWTCIDIADRKVADLDELPLWRSYEPRRHRERAPDGLPSTPDGVDRAPAGVHRDAPRDCPSGHFFRASLDRRGPTAIPLSDVDSVGTQWIWPHAGQWYGSGPARRGRVYSGSVPLFFAETVAYPRFTMHSGVMHSSGGSGHYWWCLRHSRVETDENLCPAKYRLGPYATPAEAENALRTVAERNATWDAEDARWTGEEP